MTQLTLTTQEHYEIERRVTDLTEKYFQPIPFGCPREIRLKILAERMRRLGAPDYVRQALLAKVSDKSAPPPTPAPRASVLDDLDLDARLLAGI